MNTFTLLSKQIDIQMTLFLLFYLSILFFLSFFAFSLSPSPKTIIVQLRHKSQGGNLVGNKITDVNSPITGEGKKYRRRKKSRVSPKSNFKRHVTDAMALVVHRREKEQTNSNCPFVFFK